MTVSSEPLDEFKSLTPENEAAGAYYPLLLSKLPTNFGIPEIF